jgi:hypothetical protein
MERLQGAGWVKEIALPSSPKIAQTLLSKGWIEGRNIETDYATASQIKASLPRRCRFGSKERSQAT